MMNKSAPLAAVVGAWIATWPTLGSPRPGAEVETHSREFTTRTWTVEDGLPQSAPLAITQTRDGYLWV